MPYLRQYTGARHGHLSGARKIFLPRARRRLGRLGQDIPGDLTSGDLSTAQSAYNSGALSAAGLNQILSGNVASASLSDFLAADPGAPQGSAASSTSSLWNSIFGSIAGTGTKALTSAISGSPAIGTQQMINGQLYQYTASGWQPVGTTSTTLLLLLGASALVLVFVMGKR